VIRFWKTKAFCATQDEFGRTVTVVVTNNPELCDLQMRGILNNILKRAQKFLDLSKKLKIRENRKTCRGRRYTTEYVSSSIKAYYQPSI
jgi:hypothetical protein